MYCLYFNDGSYYKQGLLVGKAGTIKNANKLKEKLTKTALKLGHKNNEFTIDIKKVYY